MDCSSTLNCPTVSTDSRPSGHSCAWKATSTSPPTLPTWNEENQRCRTGTGTRRRNRHWREASLATTKPFLTRRRVGTAAAGGTSTAKSQQPDAPVLEQHRHRSQQWPTADRARGDTAFVLFAGNVTRPGVSRRRVPDVSELGEKTAQTRLTIVANQSGRTSVNWEAAANRC